MLWLANGGNTYAALTTRFFLDINTLYKPAFFFFIYFYLGKDALTHSSSKVALIEGNVCLPGFTRRQGHKDGCDSLPSNYLAMSEAY